MAAALPQFTVDDLYQLPDDGNRYELLHGMLLVTPQAGFPHQVIATALAAQLSAFLREEEAVVVTAPGVVEFAPGFTSSPTFW